MAKQKSTSPKKSNKGSSKKKIVIVLSILALAGIWAAYSIVFKSNVILEKSETIQFSIPTHSKSSDVIQKLKDNNLLNSTFSFKIVAFLLSLDEHIYPGMYVIKNNMSNFDLIRLFRSGMREDVKVKITFHRYPKDVVKAASKYIEASEEELLALLNNKQFVHSLGFTDQTIMCLFIPDTYFFKWNTQADDFYQRMLKEYLNFWNTERLEKAKQIGLTAIQVTTLASIVDQETNKNDEKSRIAGVYINRLKTNMPLQADPTVKFALGDFSIKRVRTKHTQYSSPYNTYKNTGLPPGPICIASKPGIDAVLNYEKHNFYYFCAQPDYTGYHNFANSYSEHLKNAATFQRWLDSEGY